MHIRFAHCKGLPVLEEYGQEAVGAVEDIFVHPDTGRVEGFFVRIRHFLHSEVLFLGVSDIMHWGRTVLIRDREVLSPLEDLVRLQRIHEEGRTVLGQPIVNEAGKHLGRCMDVQFETTTFRLEWLFPRQMFRWKPALPVTSIIEVRPDAIVVRDQALVKESDAGEAVFAKLDPLSQTPLSRVTD